MEQERTETVQVQGFVIIIPMDFLFVGNKGIKKFQSGLIAVHDRIIWNGDFFA